MERNFIEINRNYSRKEGSEMYSLSKRKFIESESTYYRQRAENYLALYDVEVQVLEEMVVRGFVEKDFLFSRKKGFFTQLRALIRQMIAEMGSDTITEIQYQLNMETILEAEMRLSEILKDMPEIPVRVFNKNSKNEEVKNESESESEDKKTVDELEVDFLS